MSHNINISGYAEKLEGIQHVQPRKNEHQYQFLLYRMCKQTVW